jgi:CheY-like chemotaxis protein
MGSGGLELRESDGSEGEVWRWLPHPDAKPSAPVAQARRLLLIDDDFNLLLALAVIFRLQLPSVTVSTAVSGPIGLHRVQQEQYDLIVCDVRMPGMDGLTFLQEVKKLPFHPPVVLISGQEIQKSWHERNNMVPWRLSRSPLTAISS